ncbi:MAG TPA: DUF4272 domain-containing protein [Chthoniobacteraceae bacterium]|nr:DUF4272 domain-containing protein [Chthoniobacteraceae bacterium]
MDIDVTNQRQAILKVLGEQGFTVSPSLPVKKTFELRPAEEIGRRLWAIKAVVLWVSFEEADLSSEKVHLYVTSNALGRYLSKKESAILKEPRAEANKNHISEIGWAMEGAWSLAWVLGYKPAPDHAGEMIDDEHIKGIFYEFIPPITAGFADWLSAKTAAPFEDIVFMEDIFYCVHNAARSAVIGRKDTVPEAFHPIVNGGVIQERRKALTWALSAGVAWDDTDVST